jgi:hypothetical protein
MRVRLRDSYRPRRHTDRPLGQALSLQRAEVEPPRCGEKFNAVVKTTRDELSPNLPRLGGRIAVPRR